MISLGRYIRVHMYVYTRDNVYPESLSYTDDYGMSAERRIWKRNDRMFYLEKALRRQTFTHLFPNCLITQPRYVHNVYDDFSSVKNVTLPL